MKCPQCGHWNRDSLPRCFKCGTELIRTAENTHASWQESMRQQKPQKVYIRMDDMGNATSSSDAREELAHEMNKLQERKERGKARQQNLREEGARQGIAPTGRSVENFTSRGSFYSQAQETQYVDINGEIAEGDLRPGATQVKSTMYHFDYLDQHDLPPMDQEIYTQQRNRRAARAVPQKAVHITRGTAMSRLVRILALFLLLAAAAFALYRFVYKPYVLDKQHPPLQELAEISPSIFDDSPAHTIKIPGNEGDVIYIKELRKSYTVTGGYALVEVADHTWYEDVEITDQMQVVATLTPYLKTSAGEQVPLEQITFEVDVPMSPLTIISPDTKRDEVSTAIYTIKFQVEKNSTVLINGEDFSDLVNTQDGLISYNANVLPIGDNVFTITAQCQHYRPHTEEVIIHRAVQDIPLDLSTTLSNRWLSQTMEIKATTLPGATITIESDHVNLNTSELASTGAFSFEAVFTRIGTNTITIKASYPGKETTVVHYDVYYLPESKVYTAKAWPLNTAWDYSDLLSNISLRVSKSQIYECIGTVTQIISDSPQLAILEMGTEESSRTALLENQSTDTWVIGQRYRIYADVYGLYNGMPRLVGRYTYAPLK